MKNTIFTVVIIILVCGSGCGDKKARDMEGIYKMDSLSIKMAASDTTYRNSNQLKIYTPDFMMYAVVNDGDSVSRFGIGSYKLDNDTLIENVIFSANDSISDDQPRLFKLVVEKSKTGYKQLISGLEQSDGMKYDLTEYYTEISSPSTSVLDGCWKQVRAFSIVGMDTIRYVFNKQYKIYQNGYVMWGHSRKDSLNKLRTGVGYGRFTMTGDIQLKESMLTSTYNAVRGRDFDIEIILNGKDAFKQTISNLDGSKEVEFYERLKK